MIKFKTLTQTILIICAIYLTVLSTQLRTTEHQFGVDQNQFIEKSAGLWKIRSGEYIVSQDILAPLGVHVVIEPGTTLKFSEGRIFRIEEVLTAIGTPEKPITLTTINRNHHWRGLIIRGRETVADTLFKLKLKLAQDQLIVNEENPFKAESKTSHLSHVIIKNISVKSSTENLRLNYMAGLEILNTTARVENITFDNIHKIGLLRGFNSILNIKNLTSLNDESRKSIHINNSLAFISKNKIQANQSAHICYDGIWAVNSFVILNNNIISGKGDDGIDLKNSFAIVENNRVEGAKDEGIDVDHQSFGILTGNAIDSAENGIQISGESTALLSNNSVSNSKIGILQRDALKVSAENMTFQNNNKNYFETNDVTRAPEDQQSFLNRDYKNNVTLVKDWTISEHNLKIFPLILKNWMTDIDQQ